MYSNIQIIFKLRSNLNQCFCALFDFLFSLIKIMILFDSCITNFNPSNSSNFSSISIFSGHLSLLLTIVIILDITTTHIDILTLNLNAWLGFLRSSREMNLFLIILIGDLSSSSWQTKFIIIFFIWYHWNIWLCL